MLEAIRRTDTRVTEFVAARQRPPVRDTMSSLGALGSPALSVVFLAFSFYMAPWLSRRLFAGLIIVWLTVYALKYLVSRERPEGNGEADITSSFPSAHSATAFLMAGLFSGYMASTPLYAAASLVALSRVYLQTHYLSDAAAGSLIGLAVAALI